MSCVLSDPVSLTVTPASQANSLEGTGISVNGYDLMSAPLNNVSATRGTVSFSHTPRYSSSKIVNLNVSPIQIAHLYGNNNNYIKLLDSGTYYIEAKINGGALIQVGGGYSFIGGTLYNITIAYTPVSIQVFVNGIRTIRYDTPVLFGVVPVQFIGGE
jgi:hypothetical protein